MTGGGSVLKQASGSLASHYDCVMLDLDGVVYVGPQAVPEAPPTLAALRETGPAIAFVTNNAARTPAAVADHLRRLGIAAEPTDVVTSAQAAAAVVADRVPSGSAVLVVGGEGLAEAVRERGLTPVSSADEHPLAVVQGFHPSVGWKLLAEASYAIAGGVVWIASNTDLTVPTARGIAPGNGSLVNVVAAAVGRSPDAVAGKPHRPLFDEAARRVGGGKPIVVGDRLDTDIEGAKAAGADALLVMTGVTTLPTLCAASPGQRPTYLSRSLAGLLQAHPVPERQDGGWALGGWRARVADGVVELGARGPESDDGLRVVAAACWDHLDNGGDAVAAASLPDLAALP